MTGSSQASRVIEVACGPGFNSSLIASSYLGKDNCVLVSCDFSEDMIKLAKQHFDEVSDFKHVPGNEYYFEQGINYNETNEKEELKNQCDIEKVITEKTQGKAFNKFVYSCQANNLQLPFLDCSFDAYIANLSL